MRNESDEILNDLLSRWHYHCLTYKEHRRGCDPTFKQALRAKGEQTIAAITEDQVEAGQMRGMDFAVGGDKDGRGAMPDPYKTAIYINARNCYTGHEVWLSPRLPADKDERQKIIVTARMMLIEKLVRAGIM